MSPGVLADMWKDEGKRSHTIEEKIKSILKEKGVCKEKLVNVEVQGCIIVAAS